MATPVRNRAPVSALTERVVWLDLAPHSLAAISFGDEAVFLGRSALSPLDGGDG